MVSSGGIERSARPETFVPRCGSGCRVSVSVGGLADSLCKTRVDWSDSTISVYRRSGWKAGYATVGASLRSVDVVGIAALANCWVASRGDSSSPDDDTQRVLDVMGKLLRRGVAPPLHPTLNWHCSSPSGWTILSYRVRCRVTYLQSFDQRTVLIEQRFRSCRLSRKTRRWHLVWSTPTMRAG